MPFLDDVRVKELYNNYDDEESLFEIRRFILEYI
jgi:hypothetical protein